MDSSTTKLKNIENEISGAKSLSQLEQIHLKYLGKKGFFNQELLILKTETDLEKKKEFGQNLNKLKQQVEAFLSDREKTLLETSKQKILDPTLPGRKVSVGGLHPVTQAIEEITHIFKKIGFYKVSYPEIEYEYFSFDSLNMPPTHPARDEFESFAVNGAPSPKYGKMVLSPHTSSGQVREMLRREKPPVRMINIARCFRRNWDLTHTPMFHQFEGLCVDEGINITHLKGAIEFFAKEYFGYEVEIRLRPYHFQFTEPSFEIDTTCTLCLGKLEVNGEKCRVCKSGWLELGGAGMVHPHVLKEGKIDPNKYTGWAFGFGIERVFMMKHRLNDLRLLFSGELNIYPNHEY